MISAWDAYTQPLDQTMMKAAKLEIKMNFHAGMPLVQWRSEGVFLVFWKTPLKMSLKNLLKIIYVAI